MGLLVNSSSSLDLECQHLVARSCYNSKYGSRVWSNLCFFPVDENTLSYMRCLEEDDHIAGVEAYCKAQGLWYDASAPERATAMLELDLSTVDPALAGPKRPQDRVNLSDMATHFKDSHT